MLKHSTTKYTLVQFKLQRPNIKWQFKDIEESVVCILVQKILSNTYISLYNVLFCLKHILRLQKFNSIYAAIFPSWYSTIKIQNSFVPFVQFLRKMIIHNIIKVNPIYWIFEVLVLLLKLRYCWLLLNFDF